MLVAAGLLLGSWQAKAGPDWSLTELHLQYGSFKIPDFSGGGHVDAFVTTLLHASSWGAANIFFFVDLQSMEGGNSDVYSEAYAGLSLGKLSGRKIGIGRIKDVQVRFGINVAADAKVRRYLPGIRLVWDVPGFQYLNTDFSAFLDDSRGLAGGGAPAQSNTWSTDVSWSRPFKIGASRFLFFGHTEYVGSRSNELGNPVSWWILGQPQFRFDLGHALHKQADKLFVGIEWQFWINKQGEHGTDENTVQALIVWRF